MEEEKNITSEALKEKTIEGDTPTIEVRFSVEVTGEDEPTKYEKRRAHWAIIASWSLVAVILSGLFFCFVDMNVYSFFAAMISLAVFFFSFFCANEIDPDEATGSMPWWYGGL